MNELHLFAGCGGGILGGLLLGHRPVCAVEIDGYNREILLQRQRDGLLPKFPIWDDVRTFNGKPWRGRADILSGGFPCQDISPAGKKAGITGKKSALWKEYIRLVEEIQPKYIIAENSSRLTSDGLDVVLQDLAKVGYDAKWFSLTAASVGSSHLRERCFVVAYSNKQRTEGDGWCSWVERKLNSIQEIRENGGEGIGTCYGEWPSESSLERILPNGLSAGVDKHYAIGNGQVPRVVKMAWELATI